MSHDKPEQDDIDLFREEMGQVEKIKHDKVQHISHKARFIKRSDLSTPLPSSSKLSTDYEPATVGSEEKLSFRRIGIQERVLTKLKNGHFTMEAELDLHGMTIPLAKQALLTFITDCQRYDLRYARIIHGKGWGSKDRKPILKTKLNSWLQEIEDVLAFCSARIEDGGTGALYILLRSTKKTS